MKPPFYLLAAVLMSSSLAVADTDPTTSDVRQKHVYFGDLNLNRPSDATTLYRRIESAARIVCDLPNSWLPAVRPKVHRCMDQAMARAVTEVSSRGLSEYNMVGSAPAAAGVVAPSAASSAYRH